MAFGDQLSLRQKFSGITVLATVFALGLAGFLLLDFQQETVGDLLEQTLATQARITGYNCRAPLAFEDATSAEETLGALRTDSAILAAWIHGKDGAIFATYKSTRFKEELPGRLELPPGMHRQSDRMTMVHPIEMEADSLGTLVIVADLEPMRRLMRRQLWVIMAVMALSVLVTFALTATLQSGIMRRLGELIHSVQQVSTTRDYRVRVTGGGKDELGQLSDGFNLMIGDIQDRDQELESRAQELAALNQGLELRVTERTAALEEANTELESFSYSVAHDLRAPLRHIDGFVDLLTRHIQATLDDKGRRYLTTIGQSAKSLGVLIDHLLVFSRMGKTALNITSVALAPMVEEVRQQLERLESNRQIEWKIDPLPEVQADSSMLRLVVTNLLSNALKYSRQVGRTVIEVRCRPIDGSLWEFVVADNGAGFDMKFADKLFRVFQRLHSVKEFEGTGIGLANVRRIITRHGGTTWAEGEVGQGARLYFTLPRTEGKQVNDVDQTHTSG